MKDRKHAEEFLHFLFEEMDIDILFESFANLLTQSSQRDEKIHVIPRNNHQRNFRRDLVPSDAEYSSTPLFFPENEDGIFQMYTSRSGILEYLPEDFYAEPEDRSVIEEGLDQRKKAQEKEDYRKKIKEELRAANLFFKPLEIVFNQFRLDREKIENDYLIDQDFLLQELWSDFPHDTDKWKRFIRTLHLVKYIVGDANKTKVLLDYVLGANVTLTFEMQVQKEIDAKQRENLTGNESILGYNIFFGSVINSYQEICIITICDISSEQYLAFCSPEHSDYQLLKQILNYYMPLDVDVHIEYQISRREENDIPILGYSTLLGTS